jgi:hypothetical protein
MDVPADVLEGMTLLRSLAITKEEFFVRPRLGLTHVVRGPFFLSGDCALVRRPTLQARVKSEAQQRRVRQVPDEAPAAQSVASPHDRVNDRDSDRRASGAAEEDEAAEPCGHGGGSPFKERFLHGGGSPFDERGQLRVSSLRPS